MADRVEVSRKLGDARVLKAESRDKCNNKKKVTQGMARRMNGSLSPKEGGALPHDGAWTAGDAHFWFSAA